MKPHLSPSQLDMFFRCGEQYRRRYMEKEIIPPGIAVIQGTGFHGGAKANGEQKIFSHEDLPASDIKEAAAAAFETRLAGGYMLDPDEESRGAAVVIGEAKDSTVAMADFYAKHQAPEYQPVLVEKKVRIELPLAARDLVGIIDLADDQRRVVDLKTSRRRKNQNDADTSLQLTTYAAAYKAETGEDPAEVRLDTVVQQAKGHARDLQVSTRGPQDFAALANRINAVTQAIEAGIFPPTDPGNWACSERFCGYWKSCKYVNSERKGH
jgi:hypothetical protein